MYPYYHCDVSGSLKLANPCKLNRPHRQIYKY
ncbi:Uncharacterised protein [Proteus vulgaris]|uniref:Uncharacterized protein n=1 Tax=Proteus vulgaris TaxID=585 RepID=A0A379F8W5_PROVU|nr:hypothetical protein DR95_2531 [Proteus vulgaris]SUC16064.1 Uncharacterised protein [Proteus vulgaris]VTP79146.1 Uncharacterised protein [Proteus vulgaris]